MDDLTWLALVIWDEAQGEVDEGKAAVARVVLNRAKLKYASDGTLRDTVLHHFQFSGFWFAMDHGHYVQVEKDEAGAEQRAHELLAQAQRTSVWGACVRVAKQALAGASSWDGPQWKALVACPTAVLYFNPAVCAAPAWAIPSRKVATIGHHVFYSSVPLTSHVDPIRPPPPPPHTPGHPVPYSSFGHDATKEIVNG